MSLQVVENEKTAAEWHTWIAEQVRIREDVFMNAPGDMIAAHNREIGYTRDYHGRELLEMLQNANDAGEGYGDHSHAIIVLLEEGVCIGNTGKCFTEGGIESLMVSDNSPKRHGGARYIGNRGLGFRSILNWTSCPFVLSGELRLGFARTWASDWLNQLCTKNVKLRDRIEAEQQHGGNRSPVPTLVIPINLSDSDPLADKRMPASTFMPMWQAALALRDEGYTTVIGIPFTKEGAFEEVLRQLGHIDREALLFATYLRQLNVRLPNKEESWRKIVCDHTIEIKSASESTPIMWEIFEEIGTTPAQFLREDQQNAPEYQIRIAVPTEGVGPGVLYNYFRTKVRFPFPLYVHATLELTNNRDHIADSEANKFLVERIAEVMARAAEMNHDSREPWRPLSLIASSGDVDTLLAQWNFMGMLAAAAKSRKVVPVLAGEMRKGTEARRLESEWGGWLPATEFADVALWPIEKTHVSRFLERLDLPIIAEEELYRRLELTAATMVSLEQRAALIVGLIKTRLLPTKSIPPALLLDDRGQQIPAGRTIFLPPTEGGKFELPLWLELPILNTQLTTLLRERFAVTTLRSLADQLAAFHVQEYSLATVASAIMRGTEKRVASEAGAEDLIRHEALIALHSLYRHGVKTTLTPSRPSGLTMSLPTRVGTWAPANTLYLSSEYPYGDIVEALYGGFAPESIVACPAKLGLGSDVTTIEKFFTWLGVEKEPRSTHQDGDIDPRFSQWVFDRLEKPIQFDSSTVRSHTELAHYYFLSLSTIDRLSQILQYADPHAILAWIATDQRIDKWRALSDRQAVLMGVVGGKRIPRRMSHQFVPSYVLWQLSTTAWVPIVGGGKRPPGQCVLASSLSEETRQSLSYPAVTPDNSLLKQCDVDRTRFYHALDQVGVSRSLDDLTWDQFYAMLLELPERDPEGKRAGALYRALITRTEDRTLPNGSQWEAFQRGGKLWGTCGKQTGYFKHEQLYYAENAALPLSVLEVIPLLKLSGRPGPQKVQRLLGVTPLDERSFKIDIGTIEPSKFANTFKTEFDLIKPFVYTHRMLSNADPALLGRLKDFIIELCSTITGTAIVGQRSVQFEMRESGNPVIQGDTAFLVNKPNEFESLTENVLLADIVGDILATILRVRTGSDFARIISCPQPQRMRLLAQMLKIGIAEADQYIHEAREKLSLPANEEREAEASRYVALSPSDESDKVSIKAPTVAISSARSDQSNAMEAQGRQPVPTAVSAERLERTDLPVRRTIALRMQSTSVPSGTSVSYHPVTNAALCEAVVERFEEAEGQDRFSLTVAHQQGFEAFGCDVLSFRSAEDREKFKVSSESRLVTRFIEVKSGKAQVELKGNELEAAQRHGSRYYLYHIREESAGEYIVTILANPVGAKYDEVRIIDMTRVIQGMPWKVLPLQEPSESSLHKKIVVVN